MQLYRRCMLGDYKVDRVLKRNDGVEKCDVKLYRL